MKIKNILSIVGGLILGVVIGYFGHSQNSIGAASPSPAGTTGSTQQLCQVVFSGVSTTTFMSCYNPGADRIVDVIYYNITGGGAAVTLQAATSTNPFDLNSNTAYVFNASVASTSIYLATSTPGTTSTAANRLWPSQTYINFVASATSTAAGIVGIKYFQD